MQRTTKAVILALGCLFLIHCDDGTPISNAFSKKVQTQEEVEGPHVVVKWGGKPNKSKPDLFIPVLKAKVVKEEQEFKLGLKTKGSVRNWTFTQVVDAELQVTGNKVTGFEKDGAKYRFHFIRKNGKPGFADYRLEMDDSSIKGIVGKSIDIELSFKKARQKDFDGTPYAREMPSRVLMSGEIEPEWI